MAADAPESPSVRVGPPCATSATLVCVMYSTELWQQIVKLIVALVTAVGACGLLIAASRWKRDRQAARRHAVIGLVLLLGGAIAWFALRPVLGDHYEPMSLLPDRDATDAGSQPVRAERPSPSAVHRRTRARD